MLFNHLNFSFPIGLPTGSGGGGVVNLITNGTFDTDTDWTKGAGWTISGGKAVGATAAGNFEQAILLTEGHTYRLTYTLTITLDDMGAFFGETALTPRTTSGTYQESFVATATDAATGIIQFSVQNEAEFTGTIDDVILEDIT